jgi:alkylation response protein AidB-like acyl-CoA dehydrogenase
VTVTDDRSGAVAGDGPDAGDIAAAAARLLADHPPEATDPIEFLAERWRRGLGLLDDPDTQAELERELRAAGAPDPFVRNPIALGMVAPTIRHHGTASQRERLLRPLFTGEEIWCQLFSEPGAGSDLASLACSADRDGDRWVVTGQKVWTSLADRARWGLLLARSHPDRPRHKGLTCFVLDMTAPGVEVRPLRQITGDAEFNEVFLTDAVVPDDHRLGDEGDGWRVALTTLLNERAAIGGAFAAHGRGPVDTLVELCRRRRAGDAVARQRVADAWIRAEVLRLTNRRAQQMAERGTPGPEGSVAKLGLALNNQHLTALTVDLLGAEALLMPDEAPPAPGDGPSPSYRALDPQLAFLRARANTIEGGTSEVMRNILGERVLGLPRER